MKQWHVQHSGVLIALSCCFGLSLGTGIPAAAATLTQLTFGTDRDWDVSPSWSADGDRIAFTHYYLEGPQNILRGQIRGLRLSDGMNLLFPGQSFGANQDPTWSPDGRIAYHDDLGRIWITHPEETTSLKLTDGPTDIQPAWSPTGERIAFRSNLRSGNDDIWVVNAAGGPATRITDDPENDWKPSWSPDGTRIVFASSRSGNLDLWTVAAEGGEARQLTFDPGKAEDSPAWSPDGRWIAFASEEGLSVMPAEGGDQIQITTSRSDREPSWSPDGSKLTFHSNRSGELRIWVASELGLVPVSATTWTHIKSLYRSK